ncbi:MAG: putative ATP-dependent DNA helicase Rhp16b [Streblomastix strix]|uniref:Putative ATP-dependent DNA helicase Rhp16b n=1 Tax=Streblomastix strix TaxID=222440 RepID=A0A5J4X6I8_9EUKA|nr:MAG: putative ATP-dependent DNA helicase Rhp16b [Streblomastix strix]
MKLLNKIRNRFARLRCPVCGYYLTKPKDQQSQQYYKEELIPSTSNRQRSQSQRDRENERNNTPLNISTGASNAVSLSVLQAAFVFASTQKGRRLLGVQVEEDDTEEDEEEQEQIQQNNKNINVTIEEIDDNKQVEMDKQIEKPKNHQEIVKFNQLKHKHKHTSSFHSKSNLRFLTSTKLHELAKYIKTQMAPDEKIVVFSQWVMCLDLIAECFRHYRITFTRFDGSQSSTQQKQSLRLFNEGRGTNIQSQHQLQPVRVKALLCSLKAGGVGLNLSAANHIILVDKWWNPFVEEQAIDRVHRIGQTRENVYVVRLTVQGSVEERIQLIQKHKWEVAEGVLRDGKEEGKRVKKAKKRAERREAQLRGEDVDFFDELDEDEEESDESSEFEDDGIDGLLPGDMDGDAEDVYDDMWDGDKRRRPQRSAQKGRKKKKRVRARNALSAQDFGFLLRGIK